MHVKLATYLPINCLFCNDVESNKEPLLNNLNLDSCEVFYEPAKRTNVLRELGKILCTSKLCIIDDLNSLHDILVYFSVIKIQSILL